jgi:hypothetical protein
VTVDHQCWACGKLYDSVCSAADHSLIQCRVAGCSDHEQINTQFAGQIDDGTNRMSDQQMSLKRRLPSRKRA